MTPVDQERLLRRLQNSMEASNRLNQEMLDAIRVLLQAELRPPEPTPPKPRMPEKWAGHLYLDTRSAAERLDLSPRTLEQWRVRGGGPPFMKIGGGVRYEVADLDQWLASRRRRSTSDQGNGRIVGDAKGSLHYASDALLLQTD